MPQSDDELRDPPELMLESIPARLADDLATLYAAPRVPARVDAEILNAARAHLARPERRIPPLRPLRWLASAAAIAACVAVAVRMIPDRSPLASTSHIEPATGPVVVGKSPVPGDVDGNGRVDILDAFIVARALAGRDRPFSYPAAWDVNHDGVVDQKDVDWIANAAVRVPRDATAAAAADRIATHDVLRLAGALGSRDRPAQLRGASLGSAPQTDSTRTFCSADPAFGIHAHIRDAQAAGPSKVSDRVGDDAQTGSGTTDKRGSMVGQ